ncbi:hypothetical protein BC939DRAFT_488847 [Gamsiella multidivaricata]|uniref:uncharacterized protein n=1 Tax=Gamsiella multidivaricata TaxID=101098 RepID=UPI00222054D2|nr:uncharacterized protein BC939DRAFT_488847 [Gamsiella multidivaricata]KAI7832350.1 hypothetical protein BC939DRAFT_488847 [Gamsiella multidivaricata]
MICLLITYTLFDSPPLYYSPLKVPLPPSSLTPSAPFPFFRTDKRISNNNSSNNKSSSNQQQQSAMAGKQQGQILYLAGSTPSGRSSPGGSLSTRFQKLSQNKSTGIMVVNQPTAVSSSSSSSSGGNGRAGRGGGQGLGLGTRTGSHPTGQGQRISTDNRGNRAGSGAGVGAGIHTRAGLARAMQERGTGVSDVFLLNPEASVGGGPARRGRGAGVGAKAATAVAATSNNRGTQASRHKALVLGTRLAKKKQAAPAPAAPARTVAAAAQQKQKQGAKAVKVGKAGKAVKAGKNNASGVAAVAAKAAAAIQGKTKKGKGAKTVKAAPLNAENLDSELSEYMMKNQQTAASFLDNDLDTYMADKPSDSPW